MSLFARFKATWKKVREARQPSAEAEKTQQAIDPQLADLGSLLGLPAAATRMSQRENLRDLTPMMHERMQQVCFFLATTTPFGKRIIRIMVDHIVGEGFKVAAEDPAVQEAVDRFWKDSVNQMAENVDAFAEELLKFGELCIPVSVNPVDGFVRLGYIDPQEIAEVEYGRLMTSADGNDSEISIAVAVRLKARAGQEEGRRLEIIRVDDDPQSPSYGRMKGECFYRAINKAKSALRGISELFSLADWIDVFDQMVFDFADRIRFLNAFVWHYSLKGADKNTIEDYKNSLKSSPPRQGGVQVTNDQITIDAKTPSLQGADMSEASRVVKQYGLGGAGMPSWFFADPGDANRAVAQEMAGPTGKMLTNKQNVIKWLIGAIVDFAIDQAKLHGSLTENVDVTYKLLVPDISVQDTGVVATALQAMSQALAQAEDRGWIRGETAARAFQTVLTQTGVEVDAGEYDQAQQEKTDRAAQQQDALNPQSQLADALNNMQPANGVVQ